MEIQKLMKNLLLEDKHSDLYKEFSELPIDWQYSNEEHKKEVFDKVWNADPTPTKKYLPWIFKDIVNQNRRNLIDIVNTTGWVANKMDYIEKGVTKSIIDEWENRIKRGDLKDFSKEFEKIAKSPKDINSYPDIQSIEFFYDHIKKYRSSKEELKQAKQEAVKLYEDSEYLIVKPLSYLASCVYGNETKWCISSRDTSRHFDDYIQDSLFVFVINKKSRDPQSSKFALRIYKNKKTPIEVWDQIDTPRSLDYLYEKMPDIAPILSNVLKISVGDYSELKEFKEGKLKAEQVFATNPNYEVTEDGYLTIYFEDSDEFFSKILKSSMEEWEYSMITAIYSNRYHDYNFYDSFTSKDDISDGYAIGSLDEDNIELLEKIANIYAPNILNKKFKLDERDYHQLLGEMISSDKNFLESLSYEHAAAMDEAIEKGISESVEDEYCDVLSYLDVKKEKCFSQYVTTVDNMLSLYEKHGKINNSIFKVLSNGVENIVYLPSLIERQLEIYDDNLFVERWNREANWLLEKYYNKLLEEFEDNEYSFDDYQESVDYVVKNFGFNIEKVIPTTPEQYFSVLGVQPDGKITISIRKGDQIFKVVVSMEQLQTILKNYKLFDIV